MYLKSVFGRIDGFASTVMMTLTGKPEINSDMTDFNYSV
jgi:hypothetical protein